MRPSVDILDSPVLLQQFPAGSTLDWQYSVCLFVSEVLDITRGNDDVLLLTLLVNVYLCTRHRNSILPMLRFTFSKIFTYVNMILLSVLHNDPIHNIVFVVNLIRFHKSRGTGTISKRNYNKYALHCTCYRKTCCRFLQCGIPLFTIYL